MNKALGKLRNIQTEISVTKNQKNNFGNYNYRSCEDILMAVKPFEEKYNVAFTLQDKPVDVGGRVFVESIATIFDLDSDDFYSVTSTAMIDEDQKGMSASQKTGASNSYANKYALGNLLLLDDNKDADTNEWQEIKRKAESREKKYPRENLPFHPIDQAQRDTLDGYNKTLLDCAKWINAKYGTNKSADTVSHEDVDEVLIYLKEKSK